MARGMTNTYILVGGCILMIIGLTQYFALSSENSKLTVTVQELQKALKDSSSKAQELQESQRALTEERDTCKQEKGRSEEEKSRLRQDIADNRAANENSKTQINELQNEIDNLNQKLRDAENFERDSLTQEENAKLQVDEAEKQKLLAEEKLQECITREGRVFEDLQKLKKLEADKSGNEDIKERKVEDSKPQMQNSTSKAPSSPKKKNEMKEPKQLQPPKIHFEDKKGVVGKGGAEDVNDQEEDVENSENKEENAQDGAEEDDQDYFTTEKSEIDEELEEELDDPEMREKAQLPDVDPAKIKVEKKDMSGNTWHRDENGKPMPVIVQGDPNKPRAKFVPPPKSKGTKDSSNKKNEERNGRFF